MSKKNSVKNSSKDQSNIFGSQLKINNIKANRDVIVGNQSNTFYDSTEAITLDQFISDLKKCQIEIEHLKSLSHTDPETSKLVEVAGNKIDESLTEANKREPLAEKISSTLQSTKEIIDSLGGNINASINLGTSLGNLALIALKLFGKI